LLDDKAPHQRNQSFGLNANGDARQELRTSGALPRVSRGAQPSGELVGNEHGAGAPAVRSHRLRCCNICHEYMSSQYW
jgi:hypothetical protein